MDTTTIACNCGEVEVTLAGDPRAQFYCHCDDCQVVHGAAYVKIALYKADMVKVTKGDPATFRLKSLPRRFCSTCGTHLFAEIESIGYCGVKADRLPADRWKPSFHIQCQHAVLPVQDDLPHYKAFRRTDGQPTETVDW